MDAFPYKLPLILDGAMGTRLQKYGMPQNVCPEQWALANPRVIEDIQRAYVRAGAQAVLAPTFGANRIKLAGYGLSDEVERLNSGLAAISRAAVGPDILVGGDLSPLGIFIKPFGDTDFEQMVDIYSEQVRALLAGGVDFFALETVMTLAEARAAVLAVREATDKPVFVTFTCDEHGKTIWGVDILAALIVMQGMGVHAFGLNCSTGPEAMAANMRRLAPYARVPLIAKPNAGLPHVDEEGNTFFDMDADTFCAFTEDFIGSGVRLFGGCCGTDETHISALRREVERLAPAPFVPAEEDPDNIPCATERGAQFIEPTIDVGTTLECSPELAEDILSAEEEPSGAIKILIENEDDLETFELNQYMINEALCLCSDSEVIFESALRVFNGRAFYDSTCELDEPFLLRMSQKYGLIRL